jgi:superfamily II DNA or RNA helicase
MSRYHKRTGEQAGTFEQGRWKRGTCNVTVASFQALHRGVTLRDPETLKFLNSVQAVNVDECHAQSAESCYTVLQHMPNAYYRIGQSGTPLARGDWDNLRIMGALGPVLYTVPRQVLVDAGVLSTAKVRMVECVQSSDASQWREIYSRMIVYSKKRNSLLALIAKKSRKPCFLFVDETSHGEAVVTHLKRLGVKVSEVYGDKQLSARERAVKDLVNGVTEVLVCTSVFQEGVDVPSLKSVINGQGKKSIIQVLQRIGRGMRVCGDGDNTFDVWDIADSGHRVLERHAKKRLGTYQDDGHAVESGPLQSFVSM